MTIFQAVASYPLLFISLCTILGLLVGSFLNVVIHRLPIMMEKEWLAQCDEAIEKQTADNQAINGHAFDNHALKFQAPDNDAPIEQDASYNLAVPRSACPGCGHEIRAYENIPVISYLFLKGRCSACKTSISIRYPIVELVTGGLSGFLAYHYGFSYSAAGLILLTWALITLTMIDYDHQLLPDNITLPLLWLGLIVNSQNMITDFNSAFWGAVAGYLSLWCVYWAFKLATGKEGIGYGDFKLLAVLGAWAGWQALPLIIILSSLVGAIIGILLIVTQGRERSQPIPFGPFLAVAGWIAIIWGSDITNAYYQIMGIY